MYTGVKFSCKFTLAEIQERWYALLYDPVISQMAVNAMKQLHPDTVAEIHADALFRFVILENVVLLWFCGQRWCPFSASSKFFEVILIFPQQSGGESLGQDLIDELADDSSFSRFT